MKNKNAQPTASNDQADPAAVEAFESRGDTLVGYIASEIARDITSGTLLAGHDLNSVELATRFGTSRTPVREALLLLEKEGLVDIQSRRRPRVARIDITEIEEIYEIRAALNELMIRLFTRNAGEAEIAAAWTMVESMRRAAHAGDPDRFVLARLELHGLFEELCSNRSLQRLMDSWKMRLSVTRLTGRDAVPDMARNLLDHERLVHACAERDELLAERLIRALTFAGLDQIRRRYGSRDCPASNA